VLATLIAVAFAVLATMASLERLRRVATALSVDPADLARAVGRSADRARLERIARALEAQGATWESGLLDGILSARTEEARAAAVNEELGDLARALEWGARIPVGAARVSLAGALSAMFAAMAHDGPTVSLVLASLAWGGAGMIASTAAGREANRVAKALRQGTDAFVDRALAAAARSVALPLDEPEAAGGVDPGSRDV
jgi:hypothetical protein